MLWHAGGVLIRCSSCRLRCHRNLYRSTEILDETCLDISSIQAGVCIGSCERGRAVDQPRQAENLYLLPHKTLHQRREIKARLVIIRYGWGVLFYLDFINIFLLALQLYILYNLSLIIWILFLIYCYYFEKQVLNFSIFL